MLRLTDVHKSFGELVVLDGISLEFQQGLTTAIIGPSGTGKSVLLKHLVGLTHADSGTVECFGVDMARASEREIYSVRRRFGMLFQDGALFDSMSVGENIAFPLVHHEKELSAGPPFPRPSTLWSFGFQNVDFAYLGAGPHLVYRQVLQQVLNPHPGQVVWVVGEGAFAIRRWILSFSERHFFWHQIRTSVWRVPGRGLFCS